MFIEKVQRHDQILQAISVMRLHGEMHNAQVDNMLRLNCILLGT